MHPYIISTASPKPGRHSIAEVGRQTLYESENSWSWNNVGVGKMLKSGNNVGVGKMLESE